VHAFWAEVTGDVSHRGQSKTIYYARNSGGTWDTPVDVLAAGDVGQVIPLSAAVDGSGRLHLIWSGSSGGQTGLYHSWAWAALPITGRSWTTRQLDVGWTSFGYADLVLDASGDLHLAYVFGVEAIYYLTSSDSGESWSSPSVVVSAAPGAPVSEPMLRVDRWGTRHIVWTEHDDGGYNVAVRYGRSEDGRLWDNRLVADGGCGWIGVGIQGEENVHLVWSRGIGSVDGRYHQWSADGGLTWSSPQVIWPNVSGYTGFPRMITDSDGTLHLIFSAAAHWLTGRSGVACILHSQWDALTESWSELEIAAGVTEPGGHEHPRIAITEGNVLHVVWVGWREPPCIFYATGLLPSAAVPLTPLSMPTLTPAPPTPTPQAASSREPVGPSATPPPFGSEPMDAAPVTQWPVLLGIVPPLLLVGAVILIRALRRR
jgi:hypothetical protein